MGIDCATGDTYCSEGAHLSLESIYAAEPVIDLSIQPLKRADYDGSQGKLIVTLDPAGLVAVLEEQAKQDQEKSK